MILISFPRRSHVFSLPQCGQMRPWRTVGYSAPQPSQCVTAGSVSIFSAARGSSSVRFTAQFQQLTSSCGMAPLTSPSSERDGRDVRQLLLAADPLDGAVT